MRITLFLLIFIGATKLIAQNCTDVEELLRKRHTIGGMTYGHPYTTFDRHNENYINLQHSINNIRKRIIDESPESIQGPVYQAYKKLYNNAISTRPTDNGISTKLDNGKVERSYLAGGLRIMLLCF